MSAPEEWEEEAAPAVQEGSPAEQQEAVEGEGGEANEGEEGEAGEEGEDEDDEEEEEEVEMGGYGAKKEKGPAQVQGGKEERKQPDPRPHVNMVFIGHVDAGKSTTCGQILLLSGLVDARTIEKYEKEAKEKNRESWYIAYIMDTTDDERAKGKTVEVGRAMFTTEERRYTILDAPGHKDYVPNMIAGAAQADIGILIISARKGEFETGFERGGQTREHALLAKTLGVTRLIVAVNKMDDASVEWDKKRYDEICEKLKPFLRICGYNTKTGADITFIPMSGMTGENLKERVKNPKGSWYTPEEGPTLFEVFNATEVNRPSGSVRIPLTDSFKDMGTMCVGKIERGSVKPGMKLTLMPSKLPCEVAQVMIDEDEYAECHAGENVCIKLKGIEDDRLSRGHVLCDPKELCTVVAGIKVQMRLVELLEHRPIMTSGYRCVIHIHACTLECQVDKLLEVIELQTKKKKKDPKFVKSNSVLTCTLQLSKSICIDTFDNLPAMGRFTMRDEGVTIAIGKIVELLPDMSILA